MQVFARVKNAIFSLKSQHIFYFTFRQDMQHRKRKSWDHVVNVNKGEEKRAGTKVNHVFFPHKLNFIVRINLF